ncbi:MAG: DUF433 domain-containing protein [Candidatus Nanohaloarchaea archaeon]|nr:DUF433 domain-containing protein [Candidatus Nanohaloarchaea archaeon]
MPETVEEESAGTGILKDEDVMGGAARIDGTRIRVSDIFSHYRAGTSPEEIADIFDISLADVHAAISYWYAHQGEMQEEQEEKEKLLAEAKKEYSSKV